MVKLREYQMKHKFLNAALISLAIVAGSLANLANAGIIVINHNELLPSRGEPDIDIDLDGIYDISIAERYNRHDGDGAGNLSWISLYNHRTPTETVSGFSSLGDIIDHNSVWLTSGYQTPAMSIGNNYLGIFNTSIGGFYGYATINYDGTDMVLASYTYDDTGAGIEVNNVDVPEPSTFAIFALGMIGLASRRMNKSFK